MEQVAIRCTGCDANLGNVVNFWDQLSRNYLTPLGLPSNKKSLHIATSGDPIYGAPGTLVQGCELQKAHCPVCDAHLGQKCLDTPFNHILSPGQLIFHKSCFSIMSAGRKIKPNVNRYLSLQDLMCSSNDPLGGQGLPSQTSNPFGATSRGKGVDLVEIQTTVDGHEEYLHIIKVSGPKIVSQLELSIKKLMDQVKDLTGSVTSLQNKEAGRQKATNNNKAEANCGCLNTSAVSSLLKKHLQENDKTIFKLRDEISKSKSDATQLRSELSETRGELRRLSEENSNLRQSIDNATKTAQQTVVVAKKSEAKLLSLESRVIGLRHDFVKIDTEQKARPRVNSKRRDKAAKRLREVYEEAHDQIYDSGDNMDNSHDLVRLFEGEKLLPSPSTPRPSPSVHTIQPQMPLPQAVVPRKRTFAETDDVEDNEDEDVTLTAADFEVSSKVAINEDRDDELQDVNLVEWPSSRETSPNPDIIRSST